MTLLARVVVGTIIRLALKLASKPNNSRRLNVLNLCSESGLNLSSEQYVRD